MLFTQEREPAPLEGLDRLAVLARRRIDGEPVVRILGSRAFWGLDFQLSPDTLVPRPETEMLVRGGVERLAGLDDPRILDLGTGSGCIAIALLTEIAGARALAIDLAEGAIEMAGLNAARHGVADRLDLRRGSWFEPLRVGEAFELVVSNPPYIAHDEIAGLAREVREHDPLLALDGGMDGLAPYRIIADELAVWLRPGGYGLLEIGSTQADAVVAILEAAGFWQIGVEKDLQGLDRMIVVHHV
jgi:release factor glutamine methyltransferase